MPSLRRQSQSRKKQKEKVKVPPLPEIIDSNDDENDATLLSDEDLAFFEENASYAALLSNMDNEKIDRSLLGFADANQSSQPMRKRAKLSSEDEDDESEGDDEVERDEGEEEEFERDLLEAKTGREFKSASVPLKSLSAEDMFDRRAKLEGTKRFRDAEKEREGDRGEERGGERAGSSGDKLFRVLGHNATKVGFEVDPSDALPIKTLEGEIVFRSVNVTQPARTSSDRAASQEGPSKAILEKYKPQSEEQSDEPDANEESDGSDAAVDQERSVYRTDAAARSLDTESPSFPKRVPGAGDTPILSSLLPFGVLKSRIADTCTSVMSEPESSLPQLKSVLDILGGAVGGEGAAREGRGESERERDLRAWHLAALSVTSVFRDIIPGYVVRLPTEKEKAMQLSKDVKRTRAFESLLLSLYSLFLEKLTALGKRRETRRLSVKCTCALLTSAPHFNFSGKLLRAVVAKMDSADEDISALCCNTVKGLLIRTDALCDAQARDDETWGGTKRKKGGSLSSLPDSIAVEAVELVADLIRMRRCDTNERVIEVFLSIPFDEDVLRPDSSESGERAKKWGGKGGKKGGRKGDEERGLAAKQVEHSKTLSLNTKRRRDKKKMALALKKQVDADLSHSQAVISQSEKRRVQTKILTAVFEAYVRVMKNALAGGEEEINGDGRETDLAEEGEERSARPLLLPALQGLSKFSHLLSIEYMDDMIEMLRKLAKGDILASSPGRVNDQKFGRSHLNTGGASSERIVGKLSIEERLMSCVVALKLQKNNLDALNVDLKAFALVLYHALLEYPRKKRTEKCGLILSESLHCLLFEGVRNVLGVEGRGRALAFLGRLSLFALHAQREGETLAALVVIRRLLLSFPRLLPLCLDRGEDEDEEGGRERGGDWRDAVHGAWEIAKKEEEAREEGDRGDDFDFAFSPHSALSSHHSFLWELSLLSLSHEHPAVREMAASVLQLSKAKSLLSISSLPVLASFAKKLSASQMLTPVSVFRAFMSEK